MAAELYEIKKLLEQNTQEIRVLSAKVEKIRRKMLWSSVYGMLKFFVILVPILISIWYFQPQLRDLYKTWQQLANQFEEMNSGALFFPDKKILEELQGRARAE